MAAKPEKKRAALRALRKLIEALKQRQRRSPGRHQIILKDVGPEFGPPPLMAVTRNPLLLAGIFKMGPARFGGEYEAIKHDFRAEFR